MPGVSVIVPVYQAEKFLSACAESVTNQTFSDWELLLVDDGCTDGSGAICDALAAADSRVRAVRMAVPRSFSPRLTFTGPSSRRKRRISPAILGTA